MENLAIALHAMCAGVSIGILEKPLIFFIRPIMWRDRPSLCTCPMMYAALSEVQRDIHPAWHLTRAPDQSFFPPWEPIGFVRNRSAMLFVFPVVTSGGGNHFFV